MRITASIRSRLPRHFFILGFVIFLMGKGHSETYSPPAWEKPRSIADFQELLKHSPFSLPTSEESSPLADRYALTGIVTIGEEEVIFVFDRTDQTREMLTHAPNLKNMSLVALVREGDAPPKKATIRIGEETGTISYLEATTQQQGSAEALSVTPNSSSSNRPALVRLPPLPQTQTIPQQPRRIIRRPMVQPPQPQIPNP